MIEGDIDFTFNEDYTAIKFDKTSFYRKRFNQLPGSKGVDFLAKGNNHIIMLEVKDCLGKESDNRWRIFPNNQKRDTSPTPVDTTDRDSLDIEIPKKVAMTLACLFGASTKRNLDEQNRMDMSKEIISMLNKNDVPNIKVILFLEGDFSSISRSTKMIMDNLMFSIKKKLSWLECEVLVENLETQKRSYFIANRIHNAIHD